jgi:hypothetical protein
MALRTAGAATAIVGSPTPSQRVPRASQDLDRGCLTLRAPAYGARGFSASVSDVTVALREAPYRPSGDATRDRLGNHRIGEAAMRKPSKYPLGSRYPVHPSNDMTTILVLACAMMAMVVALTGNPSDATAVARLFH